MPHARFADLLCPWADCGFQIWFIDFQLELTDRSLYEQGIVAWETGAGLMGCCPGCGRNVVFNARGKFRVDEANSPAGAVPLPDHWFERALLLDKDGKVISF